jgi:hypothetical protein
MMVSFHHNNSGVVSTCKKLFLLFACFFEEEVGIILITLVQEGRFIETDLAHLLP